MVATHNKVYAKVTGGRQAFLHDETRYFHHDALGSVRAVSNSQGDVVQRYGYSAFGKPIELELTSVGSSAFTQVMSKITAASSYRGYTGHEHIESMDLIHMNGRVFDPNMGLPQCRPLCATARYRAGV